MAQYWLQVSSAADRDLFTVDSWGSAESRFTFNDATETLPACLRLGESSSTNGSDRVLVTFDEAGTVENAEIRLYGGFNSLNSGGGGPSVRSVDRSNLYFARSFRSFQSITMQSGGTRTSLSSSENYIDTFDRLAWSAIRIDGDRIRAAFWEGTEEDAALIPAWQFDLTDSAYTGAFPVGVFSSNRPGYRFHILSIGTDGDPAPTGPVGPGASRRTMPLLLTPW